MWHVVRLTMEIIGWLVVGQLVIGLPIAWFCLAMGWWAPLGRR